MGDRCTRCVIPASWPGIRFDSEGVCNHCRGFERKWTPWLNSQAMQRQTRQELDKLVRRAQRKRKKKYDLMVPLSGGKDSMYVLFWLRRNYPDLNILTYTYDNGLFDPRALRNMEIVKQKLGVDHVMEKLPFQEKLLKHFLLKSGNFCGACVIPYLIGAYRCARQHQIPLLVFGLAKRSDPNPPDGMNPFYFFNVVNDGFSEADFAPFWGPHPVINYVTDAALRRVHVINLPDYIPWDVEAIQQELIAELGVELGEEHFDCVGHETAGWLLHQRYGFGALVVKLSLKIRCGQVTREEALAELEREDTSFPASSKLVAETLGITQEEIKQASRRSMKPYFRGFWNFLAVQHRKHFFGR